MKRSRKEKLDAGKFRMINELLYKSKSSENWELFKDDPSYFQIYHEGFATQMATWPINPLKIVEEQVRLIAKDEKMKLADLGCGQGQLEVNLRDLQNLSVFSYDLVSSQEHVIACDIANLPIRKRKIDIAVFCLSLMGSNHVEMIKEAHRVLKKQGILIIAEVATRFKQNDFIESLHGLGFKSVKKIIPNNFFSVFVFKKIKPSSNSSISSILDICKYKKR